MRKECRILKPFFEVWERGGGGLFWPGLLSVGSHQGMTEREREVMLRKKSVSALLANDVKGPVRSARIPLMDRFERVRFVSRGSVVV